MIPPFSELSDRKFQEKLVKAYESCMPGVSLVNFCIDIITDLRDFGDLSELIHDENHIVMLERTVITYPYRPPDHLCMLCSLKVKKNDFQHSLKFHTVEARLQDHFVFYKNDIKMLIDNCHIFWCCKCWGPLFDWFSRHNCKEEEHSTYSDFDNYVQKITRF